MEIELFQALINGFLMGGIYALISIGLTLMWGVMDIINFAQGDLVMLGMYTAFWSVFLYGVDPLISPLLSFTVLFLLGVIIQKTIIEPILKTSRIYQILITIGLMLFVQNIALVVWGAEPKVMPRLFGSMNWLYPAVEMGFVRISGTRLITFPTAIILTIFFHLFLTRTKSGLAIRAVSDDRYVASLMGVDIRRIYLIVMAIGSGFCGIAGGLLALYWPITPFVGLSFTLIALLCVAMGGMGNYVGVFLASLIIGVVESLAAFLLLPSLKGVVYLSLFILVLLILPGGLFGGGRVRGVE